VLLTPLTVRACAAPIEKQWHVFQSAMGSWCASPHLRVSQLIAAVGIAALSAVGCTGTSNAVTASSAGLAAPAAFGRERLIGRWGIASFHSDKDRKRTESEARAQCSLPYNIAKGPTDGVMMHVADDPKLYELRLKGTTAGRTYLGFEAPAGDRRTVRSCPPRTIS
jgi:hypothetical protein